MIITIKIGFSKIEIDKTILEIILFLLIYLEILVLFTYNSITSDGILFGLFLSNILGLIIIVTNKISKDIQNKKFKHSLFRSLSKLGIYFVLFLFLVLLYPIIFVFFHELHHAFLIILNGREITKFYVSEFKGLTSGDPSGLSPLQLSSIKLAGSVGDIIINILFLIIILRSKKIRTEIFVPLFIAFGAAILYELRYWITGFSFSESDSYQFVNILGLDSGPFLCILFTLLFFSYFILSFFYCKKLIYMKYQNFLQLKYLNFKLLDDSI